MSPWAKYVIRRAWNALSRVISSAALFILWWTPPFFSCFFWCPQVPLLNGCKCETPISQRWNKVLVFCATAFEAWNCMHQTGDWDERTIYKLSNLPQVTLHTSKAQVKHILMHLLISSTSHCIWKAACEHFFPAHIDPQLCPNHRCSLA